MSILSLLFFENVKPMPPEEVAKILEIRKSREAEIQAAQKRKADEVRAIYTKHTDSGEPDSKKTLLESDFFLN